MGLMDNMKDRLGPALDKVSDLARQHGDKVQHGIDKAAKAVDERTKGKYSDKIQAGTGKAKEAVDRLAQKSEPSASPTGPTAPAGPAASTGTTPPPDPMTPTRPEGPPPVS